MGERATEPVDDRVVLAEPVLCRCVGFGEGDEARPGQHLAQFGGRVECGVQRPEVARPAAAEREPRHCPLDIGAATQALA